jgi:hypothetical protein
MLPTFLTDHGDLVEVMLELDESMVVRNVVPATGARDCWEIPPPPIALSSQWENLRKPNRIRIHRHFTLTDSSAPTSRRWPEATARLKSILAPLSGFW